MSGTRSQARVETRPSGGGRTLMFMVSSGILFGVLKGRYLGILHRGFRAGPGLQPFPFPRHPRDPRAVSDPRLILDEFPDLVGDRQIGPSPD